MIKTNEMNDAVSARSVQSSMAEDLQAHRKRLRKPRSIGFARHV
jgi:hypothetical protein